MIIHPAYPQSLRPGGIFDICYTVLMIEANKLKSVLIIDGENFIHKVRDVLFKSDIEKGVSGYDLTKIDLSKIFEYVIKEFCPKEKIYYSSRLKLVPATLEKSKSLIQEQREFISNIKRQGFDHKFSGNVRSYTDIHPKTRLPGRRKPIFKEKGVDVGMAVDIITWAFEKQYQRIIIASSDSDMQPAVRKCIKLGMEVVYLGFEINPNPGLIHTTTRSILLRNDEIMSNCPIKQALLDKMITTLSG